MFSVQICFESSNNISFCVQVVFLGPLLVQGIQLGDSSGLHFDSNQEYANSYENYVSYFVLYEYRFNFFYPGVLMSMIFIKYCIYNGI